MSNIIFAVNAYGYGPGQVVVALRVGDQWHDFKLSDDLAITLRDMLTLLVAKGGDMTRKGDEP